MNDQPEQPTDEEERDYNPEREGPQEEEAPSGAPPPGTEEQEPPGPPPESVPGDAGAAPNPQHARRGA